MQAHVCFRCTTVKEVEVLEICVCTHAHETGRFRGSGAVKDDLGGYVTAPEANTQCRCLLHVAELYWRE
jgi:hypothetical protein